MRTVSRWDRLLFFGGLNLAAIALFVVCFTLLPILSLRPREFAILYVCSRIPLLALCSGSTCCLLDWNLPLLHHEKMVCHFPSFCPLAQQPAF